MSILNRLSRNQHLDHLNDVAFAEVWSTAVSTGQPAAHPHLTACAPCRARYAAFTSGLDAIRDEACAEADEAFPAERLAAQHAQIFRRLEAAERPARVITFPKFARPVVSTQGNAQRWIAAAAAASFVIGLAAGQVIHLRPGMSSSPVKEVGRTADTSPGNRGSVPQPIAASPSDEALLYGGTTYGAVQIPALQPMDDITPRAPDLERRR